MKLYQVRKGQFVYFNNELHKVYSVRPVLKQSVHLIRLRDLEQQLTKAKEVVKYKPQNLDSFIFNHKRYTLRADRRAKEGDLILIMYPKPDSLDHYSLHSIEQVSSVEKNGVISNKSNGIKHSEYWLMVPGREEGSRPIDYKSGEEIEELDESSDTEQESDRYSVEFPQIGDVYTKINSDPPFSAMVIAIDGEIITLGDGSQLSREELVDPEVWSFLYNVSMR